MSESTEKYLRFPKSYRVEHWLFMATFTTLGITGLVQKFATAPISIWFIDLLGGIENIRFVHRFAAMLMLFEVVYHLGAAAYRLYVKRYKPSLVPGFYDVRNAYKALLYNLGLSKERVQQDRYTFQEKVEYWAVVWGTVIMVVTGFAMWNPIATARILPGEIIPAAKAAHGGEALLAVLAILIWHLYHVLVKHFNRSMYTGYISEEEMLEEHPLELADIKAGVAQRPIEAEEKKKRQRLFWPVFSVVALVMVLGIFAFVSFEETAIETVPPAEDSNVFVPLPPTPFPTPLPTKPPISGDQTWNDGISVLFQENCGACHGEGQQFGGLDLSTYQTALRGGNSGPGIVPGDPDTSNVIIVQSAGGHPGQLDEPALDSIRVWILAGAPED